MNDPLIELRGVRFCYGDGRSVLQDCDFCLLPGQRAALLGANGSGKTTLLHLIVGLLRPQAGQIAVSGRPRIAEADFREVRRRIGLLFQDSDDQLFCPTVLEDVAFGPLNCGKSRQETRQLARRTLESLGLEGYEHRITHQLSGGEKRLVALATVLAMDPDVLLLDEPANALDERATAKLEELLERLPQAMILVSHDREFLRRTANCTWRLSEGRLERMEP